MKSETRRRMQLCSCAPCVINQESGQTRGIIGSFMIGETLESALEGDFMALIFQRWKNPQSLAFHEDLLSYFYPLGDSLFSQLTKIAKIAGSG